jgi:carboxyl-terminal processing protease
MSHTPFAHHSPRNRIPRVFLCLASLGLVFAIGITIGYAGGAKAQGEFWKGDMSQQPVARVLGVGQKPPSGTVTDKNIDFAEFWNVWTDLKAHFYKQPVDDKTLFYGALRGMTEAVGDPYTNYFEPVDAAEFSNDLKGEFSGIGAEIGTKDGELQIVAPLPDSPAEKAGVKARDRILKIDGEESLTMPVEEAVSKIRGPKGTTVTLHLGRLPEGSATGTKAIPQTFDVTITRDTIVVHSVKVVSKENGIYVIEIHNFNSDTEEGFTKAVDEVVQKNAKGVIIDVRNNPGGYLDKAISVAGEWLPDQLVVQQRERGTITERYKGTGRGKLKGIKTVVLINEGSASASEILAGALQDSGTATIVGKTSFGKGSVQDYLEYADGSALKVTIAEWLTPNGRSIAHEGIKPDVEVEVTPEDINAERDAQLEKAIELLRTGKARP